MLFSKNENKPASSIEEKIKLYRRQGHIVPPRKIIKNAEQIEGIRESAKINTAVLDHVAANIREGMSTEDINTLVYDFTLAHGAIPAPLNYEGFPKSVCTSINEEVCHGIPDKNIILRSGDIINVDVSTIYNGYFSDASRMFMIGDVDPVWKKLVEDTKKALDLGVEVCKPYSTIGDIGYAINTFAKEQGYSVVREIGGHGVGLDIHEDPYVSHIGQPGKDYVIAPSMTFTIEPMINLGVPDVWQDADDGWTIRTDDGKPSAQWEYTLLMTEHGIEILAK